MRCWVGGEQAEGVCRFCGRAVCKAHAKTQPFLFQVWEDENRLRGLAVEDALWCGVCRPRREPIDVSCLRTEKDGQ